MPSFSNSSTVTAGTAATAAQYNNLRKDVIINAGESNTSGGSSNAYTLTLDAQIAAYNDGLVVKFKANFTNTGSPTLNVNSIGAKPLVKITSNGSVPVNAGEIQSDHIVIAFYNSTNDSFEIIQNTRKDGGTGVDGPLSSSSGTTTINCGGNAVVVKNYTTINVTGTADIQLSNTHANGTRLFLLSQSDFIFTTSATRGLDGRGGGAIGGAAASTGVGVGGVNGNTGNSGYGIIGTSGPGAGAIVNTSGGTKGSPSVVFRFAQILANVCLKVGIYLVPGAGGGSGSSARDSTANPASTSGKGGDGGVALAIIAAGNWNFTGTIDISGEDGDDGTGPGGGQTAGGGGGGGAGTFLGMYGGNLIANTGTITKNGGVGGDSYSSEAHNGHGGGGGSSSDTQGNDGTAAANGVKSGGDGAPGQSLITKNDSFA